MSLREWQITQPEMRYGRIWRGETCPRSGGWKGFCGLTPIFFCGLFANFSSRLSEISVWSGVCPTVVGNPAPCPWCVDGIWIWTGVWEKGWCQEKMIIILGCRTLSGIFGPCFPRHPESRRLSSGEVSAKNWTNLILWNYFNYLRLAWLRAEVALVMPSMVSGREIRL